MVQFFILIILITAAFTDGAKSSEVNLSNQDVHVTQNGCNATISTCQQNSTYHLRNICKDCNQSKCVINFALAESENEFGWKFGVDYHPNDVGGNYRSVAEICRLEKGNLGLNESGPIVRSESLTLLEFDTHSKFQREASEKHRRMVTCENHEHNIEFNFNYHSTVSLVTEQYSYEAIRIQAECIRPSIFHTVSITSPEVFVYQDSLLLKDFPTYPYSINHDFINGTSAGVFAELINFDSSNPYVCLQLGDDTCKTSSYNESMQAQHGVSISPVATKLKLQLNPDYDSDEETIEVQVILALSPTSLEQWNLTDIDNKFNQISATFPGFNQQIKPEFYAFNRTVEVILGSDSWDAIKYNEPGEQLKKFSELLSKLMRPGITEPVESIDEAIAKISEYLQMSQSSQSPVMKRTMFDAKSGFLENVIEALTETDDSNVIEILDEYDTSNSSSIIFEKRSFETQQNCEKMWSNEDYIASSNLGRAGSFPAPDCTDEIKVGDDELVVLTPIYFNLGMNDSKKDVPCHRREEFVFIWELWGGKMMKAGAFCHDMETYVSETNHVKVSYVKKSNDRFDRLSGYIFGLHVVNVNNLTAEEIDEKMHDLENNSETILEDFWREHPDVIESSMQDIAEISQPGVSNTYAYHLKIDTFNLPAITFYEFVQLMISENIPVAITSASENGDWYLKGVIHFESGHIGRDELLKGLARIAEPDSSFLPLLELYTFDETSLWVSDFDECQYSDLFCHDTLYDCVNTFGSFLCDPILPERRTEDLSSTLDNEVNNGNRTGTSSVDGRTADTTDKPIETPDNEMLEQRQKDARLAAMAGVCILVIIILATGAYYYYRKNYHKTQSYDCSGGTRQ